LSELQTTIYSVAVVVGIDPGTAHTGFGVVSLKQGGLCALDGGVIRSSSDQPIECRLARIHTEVASLIERYKPTEMALEEVFFGQNASTAFAVGQARGAAMLAAGLCDIRCYSYTPQAVKQAVCGSGKASKDQIQRMVKTLLSLGAAPSPHHASDALAIAICHLNGQNLREAIG
jgi:crossover junction endodeoxyribonuclease RuvC